MAWHSDGEDDRLEAILDDAVAGPVAETLAPARPPRRSGVGLLLAVALLGLGIGGVGGWRLGSADPAGEGLTTAAPEAEAEPTTTTVPAPVPMRAEDGGMGGGYAGEWGTPLELVERRATADGISVRSFRPSAPEGCADGGWCPPPECRAGTGMVVELATDRMVGQGGAYQRPAVISPAMYVGGWGFGGQAEGDPVLWVAVHVPVEATQVELVVDGRRRDVATPSAQWVALATREVMTTTEVTTHDGSVFPAPDLTGIEIVATAGAGRELGRVHLEDGIEGEGRMLPARCEPPGPPFDPPGEQPADPEAAREAVRQAYAKAWNHTSSRAQKLEAIHDPTGVEAAMERAAMAYGQATSTTVVEIGEIVFVAPDQAQVHFRLTYEGAPSLGNRRGGAVLVDGQWKVLRASYCEVLSMAGAACGAAG